MRPTMRVLEMVGSVPVTTPGVDVGAVEDGGELGLLGVSRPEAAEEGLASESGEVHGDVGCAPGALVTASVAEDRDRRLGRDALDVAVDVAIEHDVADDEDSELAEAALEQIENGMKLRQHARRYLLLPSSHLRWLAESGANLRDHLIDGDGGEAFFLFDDAGLEAAAPTVGLVVEDAMLFAVREPDSGLVARGEDGDAGGLDGGGEVHGAAVVTDEEMGVADGGGAFTRGEEATEIDDRRRGVFAPAIGGELAGFRFFGDSAKGEGVGWVVGGETVEERSPVVAAPVFGLDFGAYADGEDGVVRRVKELFLPGFLLLR